MIYAGIKNGFVKPEDYIRDLLAYQCIPTLFKLKPASLITVDKSRVPDQQEFYSCLQTYLTLYNCRYIIFQETEGRLYLLLYDEPLLWQAMTIGMRQSFLERYGYLIHRDQVAAALLLLGKRYRNYWTSGEFPHEIGIFLGYPLADVEGFIHNGGKNYILCGMWKVYQRVTVAESAFLYYHQLKARAVAISEEKGELLPMYKENEQPKGDIFWELLSY